MKPLLFLTPILALLASHSRAEDLLDRVDEALTFSLLDDRARVRLSGTLDLEYYHIDEPPFGLVDSTANNLFNPRLTFFLDAQLGSKWYAFLQARADRGFDPSDHGVRFRFDEYAIRYTPWKEGQLSIQAGKFAPVVGNWMSRHLSWDNPFISAPLPYEHVTNLSDIEAPESPHEFTEAFGADATYEYNPIIWSAAYTSGVSVSGKLGKLEYAAEVKNAPLTSRPESWDIDDVGFDHPTFSMRVGYRPSLAWNLGFSASRGPYLRPEVEPMLPRGKGIGDYEQFVLGQDISYASGHLQIWAEIYESRFQIPNVGDADTLAYYIEAKYKFTPEFFAAVRWNQQLFADIPDGFGGHMPWGHNVRRLDTSLGYRFSPHTQLKFQYSTENEDGPRGMSHAFGAQFTVRF